MSDRQRRWICRLIFAVVCIIPTVGSLVRIGWQPTPALWSDQILVSLGIPFEIGRVQTPNAYTVCLQQLAWNHPELGQIAELDQITIKQTVENLQVLKQDQVHSTQVWQIDQLKIYEKSLDELFATLHQQWLRQHRGLSIPEIHISELFVYGDPGRMREAGRTLVLRLKDVVIRNQDPADDLPSEVRSEINAEINAEINEGPRVLVLGKVLSLSLSPLINGRSPTEHGVPFAFAVARSGSGTIESNYQTSWLLTLDQSLPMNHVGLEVVPAVMHEAGFQVQGKFYGTTRQDAWECQLEGVTLTGPAIRDGKFTLSHLAKWVGGPVAEKQIQGLATLAIHNAILSCRRQSQPELLAFDAVLQAEHGTIATTLLQNMRSAFNAEATMEVLPLPQTAFDQLAVRLFMQNNQLQLLPISNEIPDLQLLRSGNRLLFCANRNQVDLGYFKPMPTTVSDVCWNQLIELLPDGTREGRKGNLVQPANHEEQASYIGQ